MGILHDDRNAGAADARRNAHRQNLLRDRAGGLDVERALASLSRLHDGAILNGPQSVHLQDRHIDASRAANPRRRNSGQINHGRAGVRRAHVGGHGHGALRLDGRARHQRMGARGVRIARHGDTGSDNGARDREPMDRAKGRGGHLDPVAPDIGASADARGIRQIHHRDANANARARCAQGRAQIGRRGQSISRPHQNLTTRPDRRALDLGRVARCIRGAGEIGDGESALLLLGGLADVLDVAVRGFRQEL